MFEVPEDEKVTIQAVGDIMLGDLPSSFGFGVGSTIKKHGTDFPFLKIRNVLQEADIVVGNLEAVLSDHKKSKWVSTQYLRANPRAASTLKECGFSVMSVANNHSVQHGEDAFDDTVRMLRSTGIAPVGVRGVGEFFSAPYIVAKRGISFGFLAYSMRPEEYRPGQSRYAQVDVELQLGRILDDITTLRSRVDFLILSVHWGDEFIRIPSPKIVAIAHSLIDSGADVILGHHPHVLQGVEKYRNGVIAYSLGNFVFDRMTERSDESMILRIEFGRGRINNVNTIPVAINSLLQPEALTGEAARVLSEEIVRISDFVSSYTVDEDEYQRFLSQCFDQYRKRIYVHYLKNIHRYSITYLLQIVPILFQRRILKRHV